MEKNSRPTPYIAPHPYLSVIPNRRPVQKTHQGLGQAKNALNYRFNYYSGAECDMEIYEWVDDQWQILFEIKQGEHTAPWQRDALAEQERKKIAAREARERAAEDDANRYANSMYTDKVNKGMADNSGRGAYVSGFYEGYLMARAKYNTSGE